MFVKLFFNRVLAEFVNVILSSPVGQKVMCGKVEIVNSEENGRAARVTVCGSVYEMSVKKLN